LQAWTSNLVVLFVGVALSWNITIYIQLFARGQDNSYAMLINYVNQNVPPGSTLVAGSDLANYMFPRYHVRFDRSAQDLGREQVHYVILSSKERWGGYNSVTPDFYDWVADHGTLRFEQSGTTFWDLQLYELDTIGLE
jgi:hypothetical protein